MKAKKVYGLIGAMAVLAVCASAFAQGGQPQDDQGGPPPPQRMKRQGGPDEGPRGPGGHGMRRRGPGMEPLVMRPDVQKELKLTEEQLEKIRQIMPPPPMMRGGPDGGPGGGPGEAGPGGERRQRRDGPPQGERRMEDGGPGHGEKRQRVGGEPSADRMDEQLAEVLTDGQMKRLKELRLQRQGATALTRREIADKVGLSDETRQRIRGLIEEDMESMAPDRDGPPDPKAMEARHEKLNEKILDALGSKERSKWNSMIGKPFKFDKNWHPQPPPGAPRGGERQRRGGGEDGPPPPPRDDEGGDLEAALVMEAFRDLSC